MVSNFFQTLYINHNVGERIKIIFETHYSSESSTRGSQAKSGVFSSGTQVSHWVTLFTSTSHPQHTM